MATAEEIEQLRELVTLQAAQLDAVAQELTAHRPATAQTEVRAGLSLVDTKLLTKTNVYSGEHDGKERWTTWSFKMRTYCAAMAPRLGELMGTASTQDVEMSTDLYYVLILLTDAEALDIVQNSPVSNGLEEWRRMVTRWESKVPPWFRGMLQAILFPKWDIPGSDVTQLLTAWEESKCKTTNSRVATRSQVNQTGSCATSFARCLFA